MKPRISPIIWNGIGPLGGEDRDAYCNNGYILLKEKLDGSLVEMLREEVSALSLKRHPSTIMERDGKTVRSVFDAHTLSAVIAKNVVKNTTLLDIAEQILGPGLYVHQCHVNFKRPGGGEFSWHSDFSFWYWEDGMPEPRAVSIFIYLDRARVETGPLCVIPGSHKYIVHNEWLRNVQDHNAAVRHDRANKPREDGLIDLATVDVLARERGVDTIWGDPGDVLIMDGNLVHASGSNFGVHERRVLLLILNSISNKIGVPASGGRPRPEYISSRSFEVIR
jgi:ectoine hydroxylase